jgi:flagellar biosynthesis/type III secretory pathway M-ring protein FliF/YscJ
VEITAWLVASAPFLALLVAWVIRRRTAKHRAEAAAAAKAKAEADAKEAAKEAERKSDRDTFATYNAAIRERETELERQLAESTRDRYQEIRELKAEHVKEISELRDRVKELEKEVVVLRGLVGRSGSAP